MANRLKYKILIEIPVIVEYYEGQITLNDLIEFEIREMKDNDYTPRLNTITDLRTANFIASEADVKKFVNFIKNTKEILDTRKVALITDTPNQVALTTLYSLHSEELPVNNKVFSTLEAAMEWIRIHESNYSLIEHTLYTLKNS